MKIITTAALFVGLIWGVIPEEALACERCFGAGADSVTVRAIGASMMVLIVLMGFMGGGIFSFFNRANERAALIQAASVEANPAEPETSQTADNK